MELNGNFTKDLLSPYLDEEIITYQVGDNLAIDYIGAALVFLLSLFVLRIFKFIIIRKLKQVAKKTKNDVDDLVIKIVDKIGWPFYLIISLHLAFQVITLPEYLELGTYYLFIILVGYYLIRSAGYVIDFAAQKVMESKKEKGEKVDRGVVSLIATISKVVLWCIVIILIISNLGYDTSALLTGLGIGGLAIALAMQTVLSDIFAYFSIHLDKPFRVGDFIVVGSDMGVVEKIGLKTTRIKTLQGQELVVSNQELTNSRINNYKKMEKRRITFEFGVSYSTPVAKLEKIPKMVKDIITKAEHADFDRAHFKKFADSSLVYEVVYYMTIPDFNTYMDTQQKINLEIMKGLQKQKIDIPFPTQTIHLSKRS